MIGRTNPMLVNHDRKEKLTNPMLGKVNSLIYTTAPGTTDHAVQTLLSSKQRFV